MQDTIRTTITGCARCGGAHADVELRPFTRPPDTGHTFFAPCPMNGEPILFKVELVPQQVAAADS